MTKKFAAMMGIALAIGSGHQALALKEEANVPPNLSLDQLPLIPCDKIAPPLPAACLPNDNEWQEHKPMFSAPGLLIATPYCADLVGFRHQPAVREKRKVHVPPKARVDPSS
jgi:hypothetical protein